MVAQPASFISLSSVALRAGLPLAVRAESAPPSAPRGYAAAAGLKSGLQVAVTVGNPDHRQVSLTCAPAGPGSKGQLCRRRAVHVEPVDEQQSIGRFAGFPALRIGSFPALASACSAAAPSSSQGGMTARSAAVTASRSTARGRLPARRVLPVGPPAGLST